ncbi:MAG: hypothetical protein AAF683_01380 [Pseudomonadota bacterium]
MIDVIEEKKAVTPEMRDRLSRGRARTGIGPWRLLKLSEDVPEGLTVSTIHNVISGASSILRPSHFKFLIEAWAELPDGPERRSIDEQTLKKIEAEMDRTGCRGRKLLHSRYGSPPDGLDSSIIARWLKGGARTARQDHIDYVLHTLKRLPDQPEQIVLTDELVERLEVEKQRTGVGPHKLIAGSALHAPKDLDPTHIVSWLNGRAKRASKAHYEFVMSAWMALPEAEPRIQITQEMRLMLLGHIERTGLGAYQILKRRVDVPDDLRPATIHQWVRGDAKSAKTVHWSYVMAAYVATVNT